MRVFIALSYLASLASAKLLDSLKLKEMSKELRGDDDRLVRPFPSESTVKVQNDICPFMISSLVETVSSGEKLKDRGDAAEALHLCTTHNPANRADIGTAEKGQIFGGINDLIHTAMATLDATEAMMSKDSDGEDKIEVIRAKVGKAIAQASETVWILSYNNEYNQKGFFEAGIVDELIMSLKNLPVFFSDDGPFSATNMWSLAALQNLASTYCDSESGYCDWQRNDDTRSLYLPKGVKATTTIDKEIRTKIMEHIKVNDGRSFDKLLLYLICNGPVNSPHDETYSWPGRARYPHSTTHPEIVPWAAAGLFKSLVIDESTRRYFSDQSDANGQLFMCLCNMYKNTPDWLEENKATIATYRMGWEDYCPSVHDDCKDKEGWAESETGQTCSDYESEKLCATLGMNLGRGIPANQACCVCGGGTRDHSKARRLSPRAFQDFQRIMESTPGNNNNNNPSCGSF